MEKAVTSELSGELYEKSEEDKVRGF